ncbi:polyprenyl synthase, component II [Listeria floridensis FSL S10-1187]|uniref:Polyprenyl synthase, component II n=1 Tax=Listeria floridensis FSL S10-1187 TaxID=1265817 RepID=A0ABP3B243_9LIST|nr:polyprenyl synthetase family protein [Listeria floridensis]EUJ33914.1 polyprenyl synthase, component II [Listeria floridensis FSL S10-1187]
MQLHSMWENYPELKKDLAEVLMTIEKNIQIRDKRVEENVKMLIHAGGKLLRPAFALLSAKLGPDYDRERAISVAAALEVLHMATLIHDDVVDESKLRRGQPTINSKYGNHYAVYTGDYLFTICFKILSKHSDSISNIEFSSKNIEKILMGELDQMRMRYNLDVSVKEYLTRISGKTAQLFALSCYSGATASKAPRTLAVKAWNIGHYLGMAFQIIDDVLDYTSTDTGLGKPVMNDVLQGVYSLPLIYAMRGRKAEFGPLLLKKEAMTDADLAELIRLIDDYHGVEQAFDLARKYTKKAQKEIAKLPAGAYRDQLSKLTDEILDRQI